MKKLILVEGIERMGKSTVCNQLSEDLDIPCVHFGIPPNEDTYKWYMDRLEFEWKNNPNGFICDRSPISNFCYSGICGGGVLNREEFYKIEKWFVERNAYLLLMVGNHEESFQRIKKEIKTEPWNSSHDVNVKGWEATQISFMKYLTQCSIRGRMMTELPTLLSYCECDSNECSGAIRHASYAVLLSNIFENCNVQSS